MSAPDVFGWCPGALRPMQSGDGLVVRLRVPLGRLTPIQTREIARLSQACGDGMIDLSARANLQLRGVQADTYPELMDGLRALYLIDADVATEARRNIVLTPFWAQQDESHRVALDLHDALAEPNAPDLPSKFGFAVDCGDSPMLSQVSADIRIERGHKGLICRADDAEAGCPVTAETAAQAALSLAHWFAQTGGVVEGRGRMAAHIARVGAPPDATMRPLPASAQAHLGATAAGRLVGLAFGQTTAQDFARLAEVGPLRLTPWRMILIEGAAASGTLPGFITAPTDPRRNISVCTGAPGCRQGLSSTRDVAAEIARALPAAQNRSLHISGCAKGCAHPTPADITLTAQSQGRFHLIRNGRASDTPEGANLRLPELLSRML